MRKLLIPILGAGILGVLVAFLSAGNVYSASPTPTPQQTTGTIKVCKIIADANRNIVDGSQAPGVSFTIKGLPQVLNSGKGPGGVLPDTTFTTPLTLNADLLGGDGKNDASCVTYGNLALGDYFYSQEVISDQNAWAAPQYNDQYSLTVKSLGSFFSYDNGVFTNGFSDYRNSDGQMILEAGRTNRTLVVLNTLKAVTNSIPTPSPTPTVTPTPTPAPAVGGQNNNTNSNNQSQDQTQNNNQTVNVNVSSVKKPAEQPETGLSVLGFASLFSAAPFGLVLSKFGKRRAIYRKKEELGSFAMDTFGKRNQGRGLDNL